MRRRSVMRACAVLACACLWAGDVAAPGADVRVITDPSAVERAGLPRAHAGPAASLAPDPRLEVVAVVEGVMPAGVVVTDAGRTFLSLPMWGDAHDHSLVELRQGRAVNYPDDATRFGSIQGIATAGDTLYALDAGAASLYAIDLRSDRVVRRYTFAPEVLGKGAYLNDVRVDAKRRVAFVSDSAGGAIVVVNLADGRAIRRLADHPSTHAEKGFRATVEGIELKAPGNVDGIALSPDGNTLYYSAFSSRTIWAADAGQLADPSVDDAAIRPRRLADKPSANDGMTCDPAGNVYSTDYEDHAIRVTSPSGQCRVLVRDPRLLWPDAVWVAGGYVYITTNQLNRMPAYNGGVDRREKRYAIFRYPAGQ